MPISDRDKQAFGYLVQALANQSLVLVSCTDKKTGDDVTCLCAALTKTGELPKDAADLRFVPLARLFQDRPEDEIFVPGAEAVTDPDNTKGAN